MRSLYCLLLIAAIAMGQITPTAPAVSAGGTVTLTHTGGSVTWTLSGVGSLSSATGASTTYTAPGSIPANQYAMGVPVLPQDSVFSTPITNLPANTYSAAWTALMTGNLSLLPSWGINYADSSTATYSVTPFYGDSISAQPTFTVPFPGYVNIKRENGAWMSPNYSYNDHHTITVNKSTGTFYEYYNEFISLTGSPFSITEACHFSGTNCNAASAIPPYTATQFAMPTASTDAANLPLAPLTWTLADIEQPGGPKHAARFTQASFQGYIWPTIASGTVNGTNIPYGARFRLKTSAQGGPTPATVCGSNQPCLNIMSGLQNYGMILADIGQGNQIIIADDCTEDPACRAAIALIGSYGITGSSFVAVDESTLQQTTGNGYQLPNSIGSYAVDPANSYVVPATYAKVCGGSTCVSIALQGYGIGLQSNTLAIAQGTGGYQIPYWITPSAATQTAPWFIASETCSGDSVTSGGVYTPPTSGAPCLTTLEATATADSSVHAYLYVSVFAASSCSGQLTAYRIDFNSSATSSDGYGCTWYDDFGVEASIGNFTADTSDYPTWKLPNGSNLPEYSQYGSVLYTYGGDIRWCGVVPNGNYQVRWGQGQAWNGTSAPQGSIPIPGTSPGNGLNYQPNFLSVNGVIESNYRDWLYGGYQYATPSDTYIPARVTNNLLCTQTQRVMPDQAVTPSLGLAPLYNITAYPHFCSWGCGTNANGGSQAELLEIIPDAGAAHLAIDAQGAATISAAKVLRLFAADWYTGSTLASDAWSIVNDPFGGSSLGSTQSDGSVILTAGSGATLSGQPMILKLTNGVYSATVTLYTTSNGYLAFP